jgi:bifunctional non-homologous end joining protein LigD
MSLKKYHQKRDFSITRGSKIYYPESQISKFELAEYYSKAANRILPHIERRPLMILRCPDGRDAEGFFQKNWNKTLPGAIKRVPRTTLLMIDSAEGLLALAQMGVLEIHTWNTHAQHIERPDQFVFDIDLTKKFLGRRSFRQLILFAMSSLVMEWSLF